MLLGQVKSFFRGFFDLIFRFLSMVLWWEAGTKRRKQIQFLAL
jgi:hypothetical protein